MNINNVKALAERISIAILNQSFWSPSQTHKKETEEQRKVHNTRRIKRVEIILTENESLKRAANIKGKIYSEHRRLTLPSPVDGMRIVPMTRQFDHSSTLNPLINEMDKYVDLFIEQLPDVHIEAKRELGDLYDPTMFPTQEELKNRFHNHLRYMECPYSGSWKEWLNETIEVGQNELQSRIVKAARHLVERIKEYDNKDEARLHETVLDNLNDICELAGDFNLAEDPIISRISKELKSVATDYSIEVIKDNKPVRDEIVKRTGQILSVLKF